MVYSFVQILQMLIDKSLERFHITATFIIDGVTVGGEELEGRESLDLIGLRDVVGGGIISSNDHVRVAGEGFGELLPGRRKVLAMATPRRIKLKEHNLAAVGDLLFEGLPDHGADGAALLSRNGLGLLPGIGGAING